MNLRLVKKIPLSLIIVSALLLPGCSRDNGKDEAAKTKQTETVAEKQVETPNPDVTSIEGEVLEVVDSGSFIFIRLDRGGKQIWATVPGVDVKVGEKITLLNANVFTKFYSRALDRTFDELIFSTGVEGKSGARSAALDGRFEKDTASPPADNK